jgi:16S rRNA processing protein RimM
VRTSTLSTSAPDASAETEGTDAWVPRPHGVRGELRLKLFNTSSDILLEQEEVLVRMADGVEHEVSVERARRADDAILLKLYSVDDRDRADELRGAMICVRRSAFPAPEEGEFYAIDIVGADARLGGESIGVVREVMTYPSTETLYLVATDGLGDWEVPLIDGYVGKVDVKARVVEILTLEDLDRLPVRKPKPPPEPGS